MSMRTAIARHPVRTAVVATSAALLALTGSRAVGAEPVRGEVTGFHARVTTDLPAYEPGDPVHLTLTVCRTRPWPTVTSSGGGTDLQHHWRIVDRHGHVVADNSHSVWTSELFSVFWLPAQCRGVSTAWDQHGWNQPDDVTDRLPREGEGRAVQPPLGVPRIGERVTPGLYRAEMHWRTGSTSHPPDSQELPEGTPFSIRP